MVTLRRDVAASNNNKIFDRQDRDKDNLTNYDKFVSAKNASKKVLSYDYGEAYVPQKSNQNSCVENNECYYTDTVCANTNYFGIPNNDNKEAKNTNSSDEYGDYLKNEMQRDKPSTLLTKEEFYASKFTSEKQPKSFATTKSKSLREKLAGKKLTKNGKIFIAVYVLTVAVVASIILAVNLINDPKTVNAGAISDNGKQQIAAMEVEETPLENKNWFDKLLDSISND